MGTLQALSILKDGWQGKFYPIHPTEKIVLGHRAYASPLDLPETPDLALLVVPTAQVVPLIEAFAAIGTKRAIVISAGFKETGEEGRRLEERLKEIAAASGMRLLGPQLHGDHQHRDLPERNRRPPGETAGTARPRLPERHLRDADARLPQGAGDPLQQGDQLRERGRHRHHRRPRIPGRGRTDQGDHPLHRGDPRRPAVHRDRPADHAGQAGPRPVRGRIGRRRPGGPEPHRRPGRPRSSVRRHPPAGRDHPLPLHRRSLRPRVGPRDPAAAPRQPARRSSPTPGGRGRRSPTPPIRAA